MRLLLRVGVLAGLAAGLAMAAFAASAGRGPISDAIDFEQGLSGADQTDGAHQTGAVAHEDLFSRGTQEIGGALGLVIFGVTIGIVFMIVLGALGPRLRAATTIGATCRLAAAGFVTLVLVPFAKYPANPPAVGDPDTVVERTLLYFASVAGSVALTLIVWNLWKVGKAWGPTLRAWVVAVVYGLGLVAILVGLPDSGTITDAPAGLVWSFRMVSLGGLAVGWAVLGLTAGTLLTRWSTSTVSASS